MNHLKDSALVILKECNTSQVIEIYLLRFGSNRIT